MKTIDYKATEKSLRKYCIIGILAMLCTWVMGSFFLADQLVIGGIFIFDSHVIMGFVSIAIIVALLVGYSLSTMTIRCPACRNLLRREILEEDGHCISYTCKACDVKYLTGVSDR